ncbi:isocitrate lyase/PEP mutase family protein [Micromonospora sp. CA-246542]|uniref:isocitrate lyase/PEP mutase family protein n=1 Tax=Micromonospora sp. CA-246542 TaxID=3239959 RepID=UPI003D9255D5
MTVRRERPARRLSDLLTEDRIAVVAGAHDALSARLAEHRGFDAIWVSSFGVTNSLGLVDEGVITLNEMLDAAWRIKRATSHPVIVDCDTGYGDVINVRRLAREAVDRGIDAICLEDQAFPKRNTFLDGEHQLDDVHRFCSKITAAAGSRTADDCLVVARTEALSQGFSVDHALERANAYVEAGADAIIIQHRSSDMHALEAFADGWRGRAPLGVLATSIRQAGFEEMQRAGFALAIYANQGLRAAVRAMDDTYQSILGAGGRQPADLALASMEEVLKLQSESGWN